MPMTIGEDSRRALSDLAMVDQAVRKGWKISDEARAKTIERVLAIIYNPNSNSRAVNAAARTLASLERLELDISDRLKDNTPQVVVNNNTTAVDSLSIVADRLTDPVDAQRMLELIAKSGYRPDIADADSGTAAVAGREKVRPPKL